MVNDTAQKLLEELHDGKAIDVDFDVALSLIEELADTPEKFKERVDARKEGGISLYTIYHWIRQKKVKARKIGGRLYLQRLSDQTMDLIVPLLYGHSTEENTIDAK